MSDQVLPPGLTQSDFNDAVAELKAVVGERWVFTENDQLKGYRDAYSIMQGDPADPIPSVAVAPANTEEVQKAVVIANKYEIPFWVISTGKNLGYGGAAPKETGMMTLDLNRMNGIEINEKQAYAVVEPGVSYFDLFNHIQEKGYKLWIDVASPGWGSVLGNTVERGVGYTPFSDHFANQCGMEVVLPDGEIYRTGMGANSSAETWHNYKYGFGPTLDGLFTQSNLGVVTKIGVWLMPEPPCFRTGYIMMQKPEDIIPMVDIMRPLRQSGVIDNTASIFAGTMDLFRIPDIRDKLLDPNNPPSQEQVSAWLREHNVGFWYNRIGVYGYEKTVDYHWEQIMDEHASVPGVEFVSRKHSAPYDYAAMHVDDKLQCGAPSLEEWVFMLPIQGDLFYSPVVPFDGQTMWELIQYMEATFNELGAIYNLPTFISPSPRTLLATLPFPTFKNNAEANAQIRSVMNEVIKRTGARGWGEYRTPLAFMDQVMETYDFNDHAHRRINERIKDALDPNGVMAPGKNGIYPKNRRTKIEGEGQS